MEKHEQWRQFFEEDYLTFSEEILTPERTDFEVEQLLKLMVLPDRAKILDLGCGQGRLAIPLAKRGFLVTAVDGSKTMLDEAKKRADAANVKIQFIHRDMKDLDFSNEFDAVINMGTAFGYVEDESDDRTAMVNIGKALGTGGFFLQDTENRERKLRNQTGKVWHEMKGQPVWSERLFDCTTGRWRETISWFEGAILRKKVLDLRLYSATELIKMTNEAGLQVLDVFGGMDGAELGLMSERMVILSRKMG